MKGWYGLWNGGLTDLLRFAEGSGWVRHAVLEGSAAGSTWMAAGGSADLLRRVRATLERFGPATRFDLFSPAGHVRWTRDTGILSGTGTPPPDLRPVESELDVVETRYWLETDGLHHRGLGAGARGGFDRVLVRELWSSLGLWCPAVQFVALEKEA